MEDIMIDSCQAHLPMQYTSNIEVIHQKLHWYTPTKPLIWY